MADNNYLNALLGAYGSTPPSKNALSEAYFPAAGIGSRQAALKRASEALGGIGSGLSSNDLRKEAAWAKTRPLGVLIAHLHPHDAAYDEEGYIVCKSHYGRCDSTYGWEIDHRAPSALGGSDSYSNLRARHWRANRSHGGILGNVLQALK